MSDQVMRAQVPSTRRNERSHQVLKQLLYTTSQPHICTALAQQTYQPTKICWPYHALSFDIEISHLQSKRRICSVYTINAHFHLPLCFKVETHVQERQRAGPPHPSELVVGHLREGSRFLRGLGVSDVHRLGNHALVTRLCI